LWAGRQVTDYRCEDKKLGDLRGKIGVISLVLSPSFRKPQSSPKKRTVQPEDAFEDTALKPGFEIVKF
jgi:hypothetical protein